MTYASYTLLIGLAVGTAGGLGLGFFIGRAFQLWVDSRKW